MSAPAPTVPLPVVTLPVVRALLDQARDKRYDGGVLGVRARPEWAGAGEFEHAGRSVRVAACGSVLAVREALLGRARDRWLVVLTDRTDAELGAGVRAHLVGHRLRTPDPWDAVRTRFSAAILEAALAAGPGSRELALGVLAAEPGEGRWPPAPGGVLTRDHLLRAVATAHLGLRADLPLDAPAVLAWSAGSDSLVRLAALRALAGDALADAVLLLLAEACGPAAPAVQPLLCRGSLAEVVPLGLVADVLLAARDEEVARLALTRLEPVFGGRLPRPEAVSAWAEECRGLLPLLADPDRLLRRADARLQELRAAELAERSDLLPSGVSARLVRLAEALRVAADTPDLAPVEAAWQRVTEHQRAAADPRVPAFQAAVRLLRWSATDQEPVPGGLSALVARHLDVDAWVDAATSDAAEGSADPVLGGALASVLLSVRERRAPHDEEFAPALAAATRQDDLGDVLGLEHLLPRVVFPLVQQDPVLLLVCDGMSAAVAAEVVLSATAAAGAGWVELLAPGQQRRTGAVAVLPTLTEHSRTSMLCGDIRTGDQQTEQAGHAALCRAHGLTAALFHKKQLDETPPGQAVSDVVGATVDDTGGRRLVTCVLNTIDDALDRSDPGGTAWGLDTVKHLRALLERARLAGRLVVLTSDHGHVIERRQGRYVPHADATSGRSRSTQPEAGSGEVLVEGRRVAGGSAVLAVDEQLRYVPLKAGYHGGGSPAEVVVPVVVLSAGRTPAGWQPARPQEPTWWWAPSASPAAPAPVETAGPLTLFDDPVSPVAVPSPGTVVAEAVLTSPAYRTQRRLAPRVSVRDDQVRGLLVALLDAPGHRLPPQPAAQALGEAPARMRGAVPQVQQLLNLEGYAVLRPDADGLTLLLDVDLLREQFDVR